MYYEEAIVNGVLCYRADPHGDWVPYSAETLTSRLQDARRSVAQDQWAVINTTTR